MVDGPRAAAFGIAVVGTAWLAWWVTWIPGDDLDPTAAVDPSAAPEPAEVPSMQDPPRRALEVVDVAMAPPTPARVDPPGEVGEGDDEAVEPSSSAWATARDRVDRLDALAARLLDGFREVDGIGDDDVTDAELRVAAWRTSAQETLADVQAGALEADEATRVLQDSFNALREGLGDTVRRVAATRSH